MQRSELKFAWTLRKLASCFAREERGATAMVLGLAAPVLIVASSFGAEIGLQYAGVRQLQHTADSAAYSAGVRLRAGAGQSGLEAAAERVIATAYAETNDVAITVNSPPASGPNAGDALAVEVLLTREQPRYVSAILGEDDVELAARAVSRVTREGGVACALATAPDGPGIVSRSDLELDGCDLASNSTDPRSIEADRGDTRANCARTVATTAPYVSHLELTGCNSVRTLAPITRDPYADVPEPQVDLARCGNSNGNGNGNGNGKGKGKDKGNGNQGNRFEPDYDHPSGVRAACINGGLKLNGNRTYEFAPGLYIINGGTLQINGSAEVISGAMADGVTFFLTNGAKLKFNGNADLDLSAPDTGPYAGILFFGDRADTTSHKVTGSAGASIRGAFYAPSSEIRFSGSSSTAGGCTQIIGYRLEFTGSSKLSSNCDLVGTSDIATGERVRVVE